MIPNNYSSPEFEEKFTYSGDDLGAEWSPEKTVFRLWAPVAESTAVLLYKSGEPSEKDFSEKVPMKKDINGTWLCEKSGNLDGVYYTFEVFNEGERAEAPDPYAKAAGVNGIRSMVVDLSSTNPEGWEDDLPPYENIEFPDVVLYEMHIRDISADESSGIEHKGKFLGVCESGTKSSAGIATGMDHIRELGITHVHLLPSYDYGSVDESKPEEAQYNWGYDPANYNIPEGSYSTDAHNGKVRIAEMKKMIKTLHENKLGVVFDVVYNHVYKRDEFCFNKIVPGYFSRIDENGEYSNGSGCGNDNATERSMVRKYIVDSVKYWADEYHPDGFRFDISGLIDMRTINEAYAEVKKTHPHVIFYNEGWVMPTKLTKGGYIPMADMKNSSMMPGQAFFSDTMRDVLRGRDFEQTPGFVMGGKGLEKVLISCFMGLPCWCNDPKQNINYISCHDGYTLFDKIAVTLPEASFEEKVRINKLMAAINLLAQGVPFMQMGEEMLRSKPLPDGKLEHNSYNCSDFTNSIKWDDLNKPACADVFEYYKGLLALRKEHGVFRMRSAEDVRSHITVIEGGSGLVSFHLWGNINGEKSQAIYIIFNARSHEERIKLPIGKWGICVNTEKAGTEILSEAEDEFIAPPLSATVMIK